MQLGEEVVDKLKDTSLGSAAEMDELVILNRSLAQLRAPPAAVGLARARLFHPVVYSRT
jgi:hypothetical protein